MLSTYEARPPEGWAYLCRPIGWFAVGFERVPWPTVNAIRRALVAMGVATIVAAAIRLRGSGGVPPQSGGWRELTGPELK